MHLADPEKISVMRIRSGMNQRAQTTRECTRDIISTSVGGHTPEVLANLPSEEVIRRDIRRQRQLANQLPPVPANNNLAFVLPQNYCISLEGTPFLQVDSAFNGRMLILVQMRVLIF